MASPSAFASAAPRMYYSSSESFSDESDESFSDEESCNKNETMKKQNKQKMLVVAMSCVVNYFSKYVVKSPRRTSNLTGHKWVSEILNGHHIRCYEQFRMKKHVFLQLCDVLQSNYNLKPKRHVGIQEQVGLFLYMLGQPGSVRNSEERFQHSGETISRQFHRVLDVVCNLAKDIIKPIDPHFRDTPVEIRNDDRYFPYFKNCIGAIDGTHIRVVVPPNLQIPYIGRKGITTTNVMSACDFNMCFTFVWAGWEGSAHDTKIFNEVVRRPSLHFPLPPEGKYYLVDSGYPTFMGFLGPYKGQRYHLPHFRLGPRARGRTEVFNYYHSSLRCTIERSFGCCKARWKILGAMPLFPLETQVKIIIACMALHNFIRRNDTSDVEFETFNENFEFADEEIMDEAGSSNIIWEEPNEESIRQMEQIREEIKIQLPTHL